MNTRSRDTALPASAAATEAEGGRILVVDDELSVRTVLQRSLARSGHRVETAADLPGALRRLSTETFELVITDLRMPGGSGIELLAEVRRRAPETRLILMSAHADVPAAASAIEHGIDCLLTKPFSIAELKAPVQASLARYRTRKLERRERQQLEARLLANEAESQKWVSRAAHSLAQAVEAKDPYTAGHALRVTAYAITIAERIGRIDLSQFRLAGELHDVGKIGVPDDVLNKPGRLTAEEFLLVKEHPVIGAQILKPLVDDLTVLGVVLWHHERWDGGGYPDGLAGEAIPLPARVLAVADTLDAMTSSRAYRGGLPWEAAVAEIRRCSGAQFDPGVVNAFEQVLPWLEAQYREFSAQVDSDP